MKTKLLLTAIFTFVIFNICFAQQEWVLSQSVVSSDKTDTINIYFEYLYLKTSNTEISIFNHNRFLAYYPNKIRVKSNTDMIREIQVLNGTSERLNDSVFLIKTKDFKNDLFLTFIGNKIYNYQIKIEPPPDPRYFCLAKFSYVLQREFPWYDGSKYTIDDIIQNGKISVAPFFGMDSLFRIIEFQFSVIQYPNPKFSSPVFKNDSIPASYSESLRKYFNEEGQLHFMFQYIKVIGPDSVERTLIDRAFATIFKDSTILLISKYHITEKKARSNIRIKISGNPTPGDLQTITSIVKEINSLNADLKAKIVNFLPSIEIKIYPPTMSSAKKGLTNVNPSFSKNRFFPNLSYTRIFTNEDQKERDLMLWQQIMRSFAKFNIQPSDYKNSYIIGKTEIPGLTSEDKIVLKAILSNNFDKKLKSIVQSWPDKRNNLLFVLLTLIVFFVFYELNSYFGFGRRIKNVWLLNSIYCILIAQLFILSTFIVQKDFSRNNFIQSEIYFCGFALVSGWLLTFFDRVFIKLIKLKWIKILFIPVVTLISLFFAYQFIYLFVRAELLRFLTIDQNAIFVGLSIVVVRLYLQYENEKISSMLQLKEHELTRQKELKNRAELNTLQAKINPHFLYNALNSIAALAHIDSNRTEKMALSLSKLFRYNLNREENMMSTIGQEIEMVQLYLQIEKQRFSDRLNFEIDVSETLYEHQVPRFLIQPLVENAIKHGISNITGQGIIKLKIFEQDKNLIIEIHDNGPAFPDGLTKGYGLQNTYDKLKLVYKKPYEIRFVNNPAKYIQIKLKE